VTSAISGIFEDGQNLVNTTRAVTGYCVISNRHRQRALRHKVDSAATRAVGVARRNRGRDHTGSTGSGLAVLEAGLLYFTRSQVDAAKQVIDEWGWPLVYKVPGTTFSEFDLYSVGPSGMDMGGRKENIIAFVHIR
jgi:Type II secretion system (T2SS), protein G